MFRKEEIAGFSGPLLRAGEGRGGTWCDKVVFMFWRIG